MGLMKTYRGDTYKSFKYFSFLCARPKQTLTLMITINKQAALNGWKWDHHHYTRITITFIQLLSQITTTIIRVLAYTEFRGNVKFLPIHVRRIGLNKTSEDILCRQNVNCGRSHPSIRHIIYMYVDGVDTLVNLLHQYSKTLSLPC